MSPFKIIFMSVSSHAPARGQQLANPDAMTRNKFQVMPPRGGNQPAPKTEQLAISFKSCPREGATCNIYKGGFGGEFQVMPPRGGNVTGGGGF